MKNKFSDYLLLTDLDGTLLDDKKLVSPENQQAIKYFCENGGLFSIATGRSVSFARPLSYLVNAPIVAMNGTVIYDYLTEKKIFEYMCDKECIAIAMEAIKKYKIIRMSIFFDEEVFIKNPTTHDLEQYEDSDSIHKIVMVFDKEYDAIGARDEFNTRFSEKFAFERSWNVGLELHSKNSGKGQCLEQFKKLGRTIVAVGDYENDISFLKMADLGYVPQNGIEELKKISTKVVIDNNHSTISDVIRNLEFGREC